MVKFRHLFCNGFIEFIKVTNSFGTQISNRFIQLHWIIFKLFFFLLNQTIEFEPIISES